jgi:2-keto-4-pentenoate hydratase/2-oxohepta-3-ene-1,7-dioic acid hydratase in catechol pathway
MQEIGSMQYPAIASYRDAKAQSRLAFVIDGALYDAAAAKAAGVPFEDAWLAGGWMAILAQWDRAASVVKDALATAAALAKDGKLAALPKDTRVLAPFRAERIFCAASNYIEHANEMGTVLAAKAQSKPYMFLKLRNTVIGQGDDILMPPETSQLDWEIELAAVIGKGGRRIPLDKALDHVAGYSIVNDISARDLNMREDYPFTFDWFQGKCHDTFAPFGPCIVPAWSISDPQGVMMTLTVNKDEMQKDTTKNMIWTLREQISYLSTIVTLEPGDVIATGTPTGVGMGRGVYLKAGDVVTATIDGIGSITNKVVAEKV